MNDPTEIPQECETPARKTRSAAAERMARHRARRREGMRCVTLDLREAELDRLVELGHLRQEHREDQNEILLALYRFLDQSELGEP